MSVGPATATKIRHALHGTSVEMTAEESAWFAGMVRGLEARWRPADAFERATVQSLALLELKLLRLDVFELRALDAGPESEGPKLSPLVTLGRYRARLLKERWESEYRLRAAIAERCTNEAEERARQVAGHPSAAVGRIVPDGPAANADLADAAGQPLNREQRRRLAAIRRRAA